MSGGAAERGFRRWSRIVSGVIAASVGLGLVLAAPPVRAAYWFVHPPRRRLTQEERSLARRRLPGLEDVVFTTRDGLVLRGWFVPGSRRDAVVLVHGLTDNRAALLPEAEILSATGHGVLLYDSRASGESDGDTATWGDRERLDIAAALDFLSTRADVDASRIGAYGFSVGSTAVALAAVEDQRIHAVLLGPIWPSLEEELKRKLPRLAGLSAAIGTAAFRALGVAVQALRPIDVVGKIPPRPLMFISGSIDNDTPPAVMERMRAAAPTATWWLVPGAAHGHYADVAPVEYPRQLAGFFDGALGERSP